MRVPRAFPVLLAAAVVASLGAPVQGQSDPVGRVAFAAARAGGSDILVLDEDGSNEENLTGTPDAQEFDPAWSPEGTRIAFARKLARNNTWDIYVMDALGATEVRLTQDFGGPIDRQPAWSPDGTRIAWTRSVHHAGTSQVFVMNADGSGMESLTNAIPGRFDSSPAWSPDGSRIAFVSNRGTGFPELWVMDADGSDRRRLTVNSWIDGNPAWSPDGRELVFDRCCPGGSSDLFAVEVDTGLQRRLTSTWPHEVQPAWSPDGQEVVFVSYPRKGGDKDLFAMPALGGDRRLLLSSGQAELSPDWSAAVSEEEPPVPVPTLSPGGGAVAPADGTGASSGLAKPKVKKLGKGVRLITGRFKGSDVYVLRVKPDAVSTMDVALGDGQLPGRERTTSMAKRHGAMAAVNGDFPLPSGKPSHPFAEDGALHTSSLVGSHNFAISADEQDLHVEHVVEVLHAVETSSGDVWSFDRWNDGKPTWGEIAAFSGSGGAAHGRAPKHMCSARLLPAGGRRWGPVDETVARDHVVDAVACRATRMPRNNGVVLSARPSSVGGVLIESLEVGETVTLRWGFGWRKVADSLGGIPELVRDGDLVASACDAPLCDRHPRTGVGYTKRGNVLLVVVDGRRAKSKGLTLVQFGRLFRALGAQAAVNLDGGGSSTMVVRGKIVNRPSDGSERAVCCALLVLPGKDKGESIKAGAAAGASPAAPFPVASGGDGSARASLLDPASTGGMLDAVSRGIFDGPFPANLRSALRVFRER
ncbi:MAG TPA: phosphodiester glycosidase family protein [Actinomycetota bacterium]|nr:phosphodiester glycosidase family protein [Actinomycetota bacterium]